MVDMKKHRSLSGAFSFGISAFLVDVTGLEPVTSRTSSGSATSCAKRPWAACLLYRRLVGKSRLFEFDDCFYVGGLGKHVNRLDFCYFVCLIVFIGFIVFFGLGFVVEEVVKVSGEGLGVAGDVDYFLG